MYELLEARDGTLIIARREPWARKHQLSRVFTFSRDQRRLAELVLDTLKRGREVVAETLVEAF